jgi:hypothetical protein
MDEFKTEKASYSAEDFQLWETNGILELTPKFQRRSVWKLGAKSFFIDTLLKGMTVPPIYLRNRQDSASTKTIREVVDGQQRIRTVLDFVKSDGYRLSKTLNAPWAGKRFIDLTAEQKRLIMSFTFSSESFKGISDQQVLEVFCRLNMNGVPLNNQELRNGKYFGLFKQSSFRLALSYLEFWRAHKLFTEQAIARMLEVELVSELLIAASQGMQDKKASINDFYAEWEEQYPGQQTEEKRFNDTMGVISETFPNGDLAQTEFRRPPMFYTLYCVVYHHLYGMPNVLRTTQKKKLTADDRDRLRDAVVRLSEVLVQSKDPAGKPPQKYHAFVVSSQAQTDNINPRRERFNTLYETAF